MSCKGNAMAYLLPLIPALLFVMEQCIGMLQEPSFILLPIVIGDTGLWLAIPAAEFLTSIVIVTFFIYHFLNKD